MKIGFNYKKLKDLIFEKYDEICVYLYDIDTRITTLETSSSTGDTYTLKMYNVNEEEAKDININIINHNAFINFNYNVTFNRINTLAIGYNLVKLGTFNLGNNNENLFKCSGTLPVVYHLGNTDTYYHNGLLKISYDTENNKNIIELIIDNGDLSKWTDIVNLATTLIIDGSGSFHVEEISSGSLPM